MRLVMFTGLPGTGKSVMAEQAAQILACPLFSKDIIEASLWRSNVGKSQNSGRVAYELLTTLAEYQLRLGQSAVLDSVATHERIRTQWRQLAAIHGAAFTVIECICSDERLHQERLARRSRNIPGWYEIDWSQVIKTRSRYEPCVDERLVLDAVKPLADNVDTLRSYLLNGS